MNRTVWQEEYADCGVYGLNPLGVSVHRRREYAELVELVIIAPQIRAYGPVGALGGIEIVLTAQIL
jgi:hypothetical protein